MILNALAATSIGMVLGLSNKEITLGIEQIKPVSGRNNIIKLKKYTVIDDCYNANPVSMKAAIDLLLMANTRKVAILGDMGELGQEEDELNKEIGIYAANKNVNIIICVGKLSSYMYDGAKEVLGNNQDRLFYFKTKEDLLKMLPDILEPGDTILIKASHFMAFDRLVKAIENDTFY
jgi:UDP-N-acetylmuramoyl-tripeptide--D-alanyl-D-alanine ligase